MRKLHKRYIVLSATLSFLVVGTYIVLTYIIDPAGVNNKFDLGLIKDSELAYRTQKFEEIDQVKPNTIMLGGSRVHFLDTEDVKKYTNDKVYNLAFSGSTLEEQYYFLKYSIENYTIKNVVIGLNLFPFSEKLRDKKNTDFDKEIFTDGFTIKKQLKHYLEVPFLTYAQTYCIKKYTEPLYRNGSRTAYNQKIYIDSKNWEKRAKESNDGYKLIYRDYLIWGDKGLSIFKKMVKLCQDNNINLKVFTTAIHVSQFQILEDVDKMDIYYKWKKEVALITPYWDFMYPNSITINSDNYIDPSHIRQEKGYFYFTRLFNDKNIKVPKDFGILVTKDNIDQHLQNLKNQIKAYDLNKSEE
jgi:hypothetical protein